LPVDKTTRESCLPSCLCLVPCFSQPLLGAAGGAAAKRPCLTRPIWSGKSATVSAPRNVSESVISAFAAIDLAVKLACGCQELRAVGARNSAQAAGGLHGTGALHIVDLPGVKSRISTGPPRVDQGRSDGEAAMQIALGARAQSPAGLCWAGPCCGER
jgi:hypothetical protein